MQSSKPRRTKKPMVSPTRFYKREAMDKFNLPIKGISTSLHNTGDITSDFIGYECPAGTVIDEKGRTWQFQLRAIISRNKFIKRDEIRPMIRKWAIGVRIKAFLKYVIEWANKN